MKSLHERAACTGDHEPEKEFNRHHSECSTPTLFQVREQVDHAPQHTLNGDVNKGKAIIISISFSILSAIFNLFAMRRDALLVKDERAQSLGQDLVKLPKIVGEFSEWWKARRPDPQAKPTAAD